MIASQAYYRFTFLRGGYWNKYNFIHMNPPRTIYLISGPLGVGKTTLANMVVQKLECALVNGDAFFVPLEHVKRMSWKQRLELSWMNIICSTKHYVEHGYDVVIDFVVEDELPWICEQLSTVNARIKYIALTTNEETLEQRLKIKGGEQYLQRSITLMHQLRENEGNKQFECDTTDKSTQQVFDNYVANDKYFIK